MKVTRSALSLLAFLCALSTQAQNLSYPVRSDDCYVALLSRGDEAFMAEVKALESAKFSIRFQKLIFRADEAGLYLAKILGRKAQEGVSVKVIVDFASNLDAQTQVMYHNLRMLGAEVEGYEMPHQLLLNELDLRDPGAINKRHHAKRTIVDYEDPKVVAELKLDPDDAVAIVGGLNVGNEYYRIGGNRIRLWRDQNAMVRGSVVADIAHSFDEDFKIFKSIKNKQVSLTPTKPGGLGAFSSIGLSR